MDVRVLRAALEAVKKKRKGDISIGTAEEMLGPPARWFSTGSFALDRIMRGCNPGGIPLGRIVHVAGSWSTGKSLWGDHLAHAFVHAGGSAYIAEAEGSRDAFFSERIGVDGRKVIVDEPETLEAAFENFVAYHAFVRKRDKTSPLLYLLDSLDAAKAERAMADMTESKGYMYGGGKSGVLSIGLGKLAGICRHYPTSAVILNQVRDNVGVLFGPQQYTPGGNPPHFYASLEVWLSGAPRPDGGYVYSKYAGQDFTEEERKRLGIRQPRGFVEGRWVRARITKSKVSGTFGRTVDYYIDFRRGIGRGLGLDTCLMVEGLLLRKNGALEQRRWVDVDRTQTETVATFATLQEWADWLSKPDNFTHCLGEPST